MYPTARYLRYCAWVRAMGKRLTWIGYGDWLGAGEPEANRDRYAGTALDRMVRRDMVASGQLPLFEGER